MKKADLEARCHGNMGATGFWVACAEGHVGVVELLAGKMHSTTLPKVDIRSPNEHGVEPLRHAEAPQRVAPGGGGHPVKTVSLERAWARRPRQGGRLRAPSVVPRGPPARGRRVRDWR